MPDDRCPQCHTELELITESAEKVEQGQDIDSWRQRARCPECGTDLFRGDPEGEWQLSDAP